MCGSRHWAKFFGFRVGQGRPIPQGPLLAFDACHSFGLLGFFRAEGPKVSCEGLGFRV